MAGAAQPSRASSGRKRKQQDHQEVKHLKDISPHQELKKKYQDFPGFSVRNYSTVTALLSQLPNVHQQSVRFASLNHYLFLNLTITINPFLTLTK